MFIPEIEVDSYRKCGVENVVPVPMSVRGITATRNWILDYAEREGIERVVMVDDDVADQGYWEAREFNFRRIRMNEEMWIREWEKLFEITEELKYRIFGVSTDGAPRSVYPYRPFIFHTYVTASCMGILVKSGIRFDESFPVKEDYEITLRCILEDGGVVGARYLFWRNDHWGGEGGCKTYRTQPMEKTAISRLIKMYPGMIRRVTRGGSEYSIDLTF